MAGVPNIRPSAAEPPCATQLKGARERQKGLGLDYMAIMTSAGFGEAFMVGL